MDDDFNWTGAWDTFTAYSLDDVSIASDNKAYLALKSGGGFNPIGDATGHWSTPLDPVNLNGWTGKITIAPIGPNELSQTPTIAATPVTIQGLSGTIGIKYLPAQSAGIAPDTYHHWLTMTDPVGNIYYYLSGNFTWSSP